jgi:hypothetical protein
MTYKEILEMVSNSAYNQFFKGLNYGGLQNTLVECATKIYIAQMQLEKEKLQEEYDGLNKKRNENLYRCSKECNEPCQETTNLNDLTVEEKVERLKELLDNKEFKHDEDLY